MMRDNDRLADAMAAQRRPNGPDRNMRMGAPREEPRLSQDDICSVLMDEAIPACGSVRGMFKKFAPIVGVDADFAELVFSGDIALPEPDDLLDPIEYQNAVFMKAYAIALENGVSTWDEISKVFDDARSAINELAGF